MFIKNGKRQLKYVHRDPEDEKLPHPKHTEMIFSMAPRRKTPGFVTGSNDGSLIAWLVIETNDIAFLKQDVRVSISNREEVNKDRPIKS